MSNKIKCNEYKPLYFHIGATYIGSTLNEWNLSHQCKPLSCIVVLSPICRVLSKNNANKLAANGSDEKITFVMSLNY